MNREERLRQDGITETPILFYRPSDQNGTGSNYSLHHLWLPHPFTGARTRYATGEHRYQAMKATSAEDHDTVNRQPTANLAKRAGGRGGIRLRDGWGSWYGDLCYLVMLEVTLTKTRQHEDVAAWLATTGTRHIYEDSPTDDIWGWRHGPDHRGRNLLGRCWMQTRYLLAAQMTLEDAAQENRIVLPGA